jgi:hypothetical protein
MDLGGRSVKGDHLGSLSFHEAGDPRRDQRPIGVERIGGGLASDVIEYLGKVRPEHRLPTGDGPLAAAQGSGLVQDSGDLIKGQFVLFFRGVGWNVYPAVPAGVVATVGEVKAPFQRKAGSVSNGNPFTIVLHRV